MERSRRLAFREALVSLGINGDEDQNVLEGKVVEEPDELVSDDEDDVQSEVMGSDANDDEGDIDVFEEEEQSDDGEDSDEDNVNDNPHQFANDLLSPSGIRYSIDEIQPALRRRNVLRQRPRALSNPQTELQAFSLFHTNDIVLHILRETNRKVQQVNRENNGQTAIKRFNESELHACLAVVLRAGVDRDNMSDLSRLWNPTDSRPFYRAAIGHTRFRQFLRCIRFDNIYTRAERQNNDKLAAIRDVWTLFLATLTTCGT